MNLYRPHVTFEATGVSQTEGSCTLTKSYSVEKTVPFLNLVYRLFPSTFAATTTGRCAKNGNNIILPAESAIAWVSSDNGLTWTLKDGTTLCRFITYVGNDIFVGSPSSGGTLARSIDNGVNWSTSSTTATYISCVDFANGKVLATTSLTTARVSADQGATWSDLTLPIEADRCKAINGVMVAWLTSTATIAIAVAADLSAWVTITAPYTIVDVVVLGSATLVFCMNGTTLTIAHTFDMVVPPSPDWTNGIPQPTWTIGYTKASTSFVGSPAIDENTNQVVFAMNNGTLNVCTTSQNVTSISNAVGTNLRVVPMNGNGHPFVVTSTSASTLGRLCEANPMITVTE